MSHSNNQGPAYTPDQLRAIREDELQISLETMSEEIGYPYSVLQRYETGRAEMTPDFIRDFEALRTRITRERAAGGDPPRLRRMRRTPKAEAGQGTQQPPAPPPATTPTSTTPPPETPVPTRQTPGLRLARARRIARWRERVTRWGTRATAGIFVLGLLLVLRGWIRADIRAEFLSLVTRAAARYPAPNQARPPCELPPKGREVELNGRCWYYLGPSPCGVHEFHDQGRCYVPAVIVEDKPPPQSEKNSAVPGLPNIEPGP